MSYILKQFDTPLLKFNINKELDGISTEILWRTEDKKHLLPLDMDGSEKQLAKWLKNRTIPSNRAYVQNFLAKLGLNEKDTKGIIDFCHSLSLNDAYWVIDEDFDGQFANFNLYDNKFSNTLSYIAFTGYGSYVRSSLRSSPEFTTGGMLAKCWRRIDGKITLYKSGTEGFANSGNEPYAEFYAYQIAEKMGLKSVKYGLSKWKGKLCSTCELFTSKDISYIPIARLVRDGGLKAVLQYYKDLGEEYYQELISMFVFDAVICNEDRHYGNFGLLVDNATNQIVGTAPIFDNGLSLFYSSMATDMKELEQFEKLRRPAAYEDFYELVKQTMGPKQREELHKLIGFKLKKHPRYNWNEKRLKMLETVIARRVSELLKL